MTSADMVRSVVGLINTEILEDTDTVEAILSFDDRTVPQPLTKIYFAFLIGEDKVSLLDEATTETCQLTELTISMNCYAPPGDNAIEVAAHAEYVLSRVNENFGGMMQGYEIGTAVIDDYLKALKIPCQMHFHFEQCPAFNVSGSVILPFADFFCKAHVVDQTVHLSIADRTRLSEPFVSGRYVGLGAYNPTTINLGFQPKLVLLFATDGPIVDFDVSHNTRLSRAGIAATGAAGAEIRLLSAGFSVSQPDRIPYDSSITSLNEANRSYGYVAFR